MRIWIKEYIQKKHFSSIVEQTIIQMRANRDEEPEGQEHSKARRLH